MSGKHPDLEQKKLGEYPGPGAYNPSADFGAPNYSIGRSQRPQSGKTGSPGPGAYSPKMRPSSSGPLIGTGKRPPLSDAFEIPGPGAYNFQSSVDGPQFSMTGRSYKSQKEKSPGPGAYSHKDLHKTPAYSVPRAPRTDRYGEEVPGPGNYELSARQTGTK